MCRRSNGENVIVATVAIAGVTVAEMVTATTAAADTARGDLTVVVTANTASTAAAAWTTEMMMSL